MCTLCFALIKGCFTFLRFDLAVCIWVPFLCNPDIITQKVNSSLKLKTRTNKRKVPVELPPDIQIALHLGRVAKKLILKTWQSASPTAFVHGIKSQNQRTVQSQGRLTGDDEPLFQQSHIIS